GPATRRIRDAGRRSAYFSGRHRARWDAVRYPAATQPARGARAVRCPRRRARRHRRVWNRPTRCESISGARAAVRSGKLAKAVSVLDRELGRQLAEFRRPPAEVCQAWRMLRASSGTVSIAQVAREVGWSDRHLSRGFQREIGLTPKAAARVIRFDRARRLLPRHGGAVVAAECGYADQAHLIREFVSFTGLSPTR